MIRRPFKMLPSRGASARRPGGRWITGRASFVWLHGVLIPLAIGEENIEIRRRSPDGPWHRITGTADEAWEEIQAGYRMQTGLKRKVASHRRRRGMPV